VTDKDEANRRAHANLFFCSWGHSLPCVRLERGIFVAYSRLRAEGGDVMRRSICGSKRLSGPESARRPHRLQAAARLNPSSPEHGAELVDTMPTLRAATKSF